MKKTLAKGAGDFLSYGMKSMGIGFAAVESLLASVQSLYRYSVNPLAIRLLEK